MNREEGRIGGEDLVPGPEERPGRDVFPFDPAVREEHVEAFETEILEDRLDQAGHSGFWRIEIELSLLDAPPDRLDRKSTRLNSSHTVISYAVFCLKKK